MEGANTNKDKEKEIEAWAEKWKEKKQVAFDRLFELWYDNTSPICEPHGILNGTDYERDLDKKCCEEKIEENEKKIDDLSIIFENLFKEIEQKLGIYLGQACYEAIERNKLDQEIEQIFGQKIKKKERKK